MQPQIRRLVSLGAVALFLPLYGCTSTGGGINVAAEMEAIANDPSLPEQVAVLPAFSPVAPAAPAVAAMSAATPADTTASVAQNAAAAPSAAPLPGVRTASLGSDRAFMPSGYAGTTPQGPKAAALIEGGFPIQNVSARSPELDRLISHYAGVHQIPETLLRRVVNRESTFNPAARNGPYWGLMQILPATARSMGYQGPPQGLLDAETNLRYAGKYLRGAYLVADGNHDQAVRLYARGYYYDAKRKGLLEATGLR